MKNALPIIDVTELMHGDAAAVAEAIGRACRESGFFYAVGHGVDESRFKRLEHLSRKFFALDLETKMAIRMELAGSAWRGFFPIGTELTSGRPDQKEGLYFGAELPSDDPRVKAGLPLHGCNLFPEVAEFRDAVLQYMDAMTNLGHDLLRGIALSLGLSESFFFDNYTRDPLILFRIFHYPPLAAGANDEAWSVGEHTDYGLLTILYQDESGGLQVKSQSRWIDAPPLEGSLVCNIGDMLDRMTGGVYRSTPHRVRNRGEQGRLSFPFFFDPNFDAEIQPIHPDAVVDDSDARWDKANVHEFRGTYGDYLLRKIGKVFPQLRRDAM